MMVYIIKNSGKGVLRNFASVQDRAFMEEKKVRTLQKESITLDGHIEEQKQELKDLAVEKTRRLLDMKDPQEQKSKLVAENEDLKVKVVEGQKALETEINAKSSIIQKAETATKDAHTEVESSRVLLKKEAEESHKKLDKELNLKLDSAKRVKEDILGNIKHLEDEQNTILQGNIELKEDGAKSLKELTVKRDVSKLGIDTYRKDVEEDIVFLKEKKIVLTNEIQHLKGKKNLIDNFSSLEVVIASRKAVLEISLKGISKELETIQKKNVDAIAEKSDIEKNAEFAKQSIKQEIDNLNELKQVSKELMREEIGLLEVKKHELIATKEGIEGEIQDAVNALADEKEHRTKFVKDTTKELIKEEEKLNVYRLYVSQITEQIATMKPIAEELSDFIAKESDARERYDIEKSKLDKAEVTHKKVVNESQEKMQEWKTKNEELDQYKEYIKNYSGRLTSNIHKVHQITELMNQKMKRENILIRLGLPVDKIEIPF